MSKVKLKSEEILSKFYRFIKGKMKIMSVIGILGFPLYYFVWKNLLPQSYENLPLRIFCAAISIPWIFNHLVSEKLEKKYTIYIFFSILLCLPFFFSFMWIKNGFSSIWTMSYIVQLFLLFLLIYSWSLIYIISVIGFGLACLSVYIIDGQILFTAFNLAYIPIFLFVILTSIVFHHHEADHTEKEGVLSSFGASIAHEMRNSIAISIGASRIALRILDENKEKDNNKKGVLIQEDDVDEIHHTMELLQSSSFRTSMVIDILLKNIHNQQIETDKFIHLSISDILNTAINEFGYKEGEKEKIKIDHIDKFMFFGNKDLMIFAILNLLNNAFTYNTSNHCEIHIWTETNEKTNTLHIRDNGSGIPKDKLSLIFDRFMSIGNKGGAGLGLTFCKRVMMSFKGEITCKSEIGQYTEFIMKFPPVNKNNIEKSTNHDSNKKDKLKKSILQVDELHFN